MVQIVWEDVALAQLKRHLEYACLEFGIKTMNKFIKEVENFEERLRLYPLSYSKVPQLAHRAYEYRGCTVMRNFKLVYHYDDSKETVFVVYIWDMRMHPDKMPRYVK